MSRKVTYLGYTLASYVDDNPKLEFNQFLEISENFIMYLSEVYYNRVILMTILCKGFHLDYAMYLQCNPMESLKTSLFQSLCLLQNSFA